MKKNIRLVALDLDGTLLNAEKKVTPRCREALEALEDVGVLVVPVTGRPVLPPEVLGLAGLRYAVTSNGVTIQDFHTGKALLEQRLTAEQCRNILETCAHFDMVREIIRDGTSYLSPADFARQSARYGNTPMGVYFRNTRKTLPGSIVASLRTDDSPVEELYFLTDSPQMRMELEETLSLLPDIGFVHPSPKDLEVVAGEANKGAGLQHLLDYLGISPEEVMAIGDEASDLPMLRLAGIAVAVENGNPAVKAEADFVAPSCNEDGVAVAVEKFVLDGQAHYDPAKTVTAEELYRELGITEADLADYDEIELE